MSLSPDFYEHTHLFYDNLRELLGRSAIQVTPQVALGTGLLNNRSSVYIETPRPRMIVVSGLAGLIGRILGEAVSTNLLVVGMTTDDYTTAAIRRIYAACPGTAKNMLKRIDIDGEEIVKLSHSAHIAEPQRCNAGQAELFYREIYAQLDHL